MASSSITSWEIDKENVEAVTDFIFLGSKVTMDSVCNHKIKRHLLLGRKAVTNLDSVLKHRFLFAGSSMYSQSYGFFSSHVMYGCENWTIKKAEHWRNDAFQLWCWRRHLRAPWIARKSNQSILKVYSGNQPWIFIGRSDAETPVLWTPDAESRLIVKDPDAEKDWRQKEKRAA